MMRKASFKHRKMKPQERLLTVILLTSIVTASPIKYKYTRIPDCDYLENDGTQHNAMELPNKFCCFCGKGKYFADFCNDQDPKSTVCLNCTYTEDYKSYIDYEPHILEKCMMQEPCMPGKIEVNGSRSQKSSCICPDGMVEVDRHCEPDNIHVPTPTQNLIIPSTVPSPGDKTGEETKNPKTDAKNPSTAVTDKPVEPTNSQSETMATGTENTSTPKIDQFIDITNSPGSTLSTTSQNQKGSNEDMAFTVVSVIKILAVIIGIFILVGIIFLVCCIQKKYSCTKRDNKENLDVNDSTVRFVNDNSSNNAEEENVGETRPMISDSNSSVNATESYASDSLQSINTGNSNPMPENSSSADDNTTDEKVFQNPVIAKPHPESACHDQAFPMRSMFVPQDRDDTTESSDITKLITKTNESEERSLELVMEEYPPSQSKAGPIEQRPGPRLEPPEIAVHVNNPPNAYGDVETEREKCARVLRGWEAKITKRDLLRIARKLLPQNEHVYIEDMMEKYPYDTQEAAHQIFVRVQQVNSNLSLQEMLPVVEHLGYLRDILLSEM